MGLFNYNLYQNINSRKGVFYAQTYASDHMCPNETGQIWKYNKDFDKAKGKWHPAGDGLEVQCTGILDMNYPKKLLLNQ